MAYSDTPLGSQAENRTQQPMKENFDLLKKFLEIDHASILGEGTHKQLTLPRQAAPAAPAANQLAIFSRLSAFTGKTELCLQKENAGDVIEFTSCLKNINGWAILSSGLLIKWGLNTTGLSGNQTFAYPVAATIPVFTAVYTVQASVYRAGIADSNTAVRIVDYSNPTQLTVRCTRRRSAVNAATHFTWLAIGAYNAV